MSPQWKTVTFGEVVDLEQGLAFNKRTNHLMAEKGIPLLRITDLINNTQTKFVDEQKVPRKFIANPKDIIYTRTGQVGLVFKGKVGIVHNNCFRVIPRDGVERDYVYWYLRQPSIIQQARTLASGAAQPDLGHDAFKSIEFAYPEPQVQRRIAGILSAYDDLIENNQRRIKILEEMAQSLYREWFVHFRFPGHDKVKMVPSPLGPIPQGWEVTRLDEIAENFDRLRKPLSKMERAEMQGEYPYYGAAKVFDYVNNFIFNGEYLLMAEDGSVITPERAPVLQLANEKFWLNNHTHILSGKAPVSTHFLYLGLSLVDISPYITGAAQPKITQENMNRIPFFCGPADLHKHFDRLVAPMIHGSQVFQRMNNNLRRTRDLLLPRLLSGELSFTYDA